MYLANYTYWNEGGRKYVNSQDMDIVDLHMGVEHRQHGAKLAASGRQWKKMGGSISCAQPSPRSGQTGNQDRQGGSGAWLKAIDRLPT